MTICISVKTAEGLVLAADSAVTLQQTQFDANTGHPVSQQIVQTFEYASKVTQLKDYPIGVMAWGIADIQQRSIQSLVMEYEYGLKERGKNKGYEVKVLAQGLIDFIMERYNKAFDPNAPNIVPPEHRGFGMLIGGYSHDEFFPEQYAFEFPQKPTLEDARPDLPDGRPNFGAQWYGMTDALVRLIKGFDPRGLDDLINRGVDRNTLQQWVDDNVSSLPLIFDGMPLQDAVDFAEYCAQVVIGRFRFGAGPNLCGGAVDIAVIRPKSFAWAQRKRWSIKEERV